MPIQVAQTRTEMAAYYGTITPFIALATTAPGATAGTEVTGGTPAYARKATNWGTAAASVIAGSPAAHDVPSGVTVRGVNLMSAVTAGAYKDGAVVTDQPFSSQGQFTVTPTYTQG